MRCGLMMLWRAVLVAAAVLPMQAVLLRQSALAQEASSLLHGAQTAYDEADFDGALRALESTSSANGLSDADLTPYLELRALVHLGLGDREGAASDLRALLSARGDYTPAETAPPAFRRLFAQVARDSVAPIEVELTATAETGVLHAHVAVRGDAQNLAREIRVYSRSEGQRRYQTHVGASVDIRSTAPGIDAYAELIGPGGAVLVRAGSAELPQHFVVPQPVADEVVVPPEGGGDDTVLIVALIIGGVALVAGGVVVAVVVAGQSPSETQLLPPVVVTGLSSAPAPQPIFRF